VALFVVTLGKTWVIIWNLHFFWFLYIHAGNMSVKKWHQLAEEKSAVDQQTQDIHQQFRKNKINKEFGQLSGEELFKPITRRLDEKSSATVEEEEEEQEVPDYTMDEFDEINSFGDEFRPDASTPAPSPPPSPKPTPPPPPPTSPLPPYEDVDDDFQPPPPPLKEKSTRKEWGCRDRLSLNINMNQPCCKRSIS